jgi:hypothetical protein
MPSDIHTIYAEHPPHEGGVVMDGIVDEFVERHGLGAVVVDMTARLGRRREEMSAEERRLQAGQDREALARRIELACQKLEGMIARFRELSGVTDDTLPIIRSIDRGVLKVKIISRNPRHLRIDTFEQSEGDTVSLRLGETPVVSQTTRFSGDEKYELLGGGDKAIVLDDMIENLEVYLRQQGTLEPH